MYVRRPSEVPLTAAIAALLVLLQGCAGFQIPEEPARPTPITPVWSTEELYEHIRYLNRSEVRGRATGTQAYARAAAYVSSRMAEFGLQPAVEGDYRTIYSAPINHPIAGQLRVVSPDDSLAYLAGIEFLPDGRSDSGAVAISRFVVAGGDVDPERSADRNFGILVAPGEHVDLHAWQAAGAELAVLIGPLEPRFAPAPIRGLIVVQLTPRAARHLFRLGEAPIGPYLDERMGEIIVLGRRLHAHVVTSYQSRAGAINMMGYFSGKHPERRRQLVIVCADLDAVGQYSGVSTMDFRSFGTAPAALLEVARNIGFVTRRWQVPDRSVLVAVWSGSRVGHAGLRYYLEHPTWPISRIASVVYVGLAESDRPQVQRLLDSYGIRLVAVSPPADRLYPDDILLLPDASLQRLARALDDDLEPIEPPDMSQLIDSAVVQALKLADRAYERTMVETTDPAPFVPVREDTLRAPTAEGTR